MPKNQLPTNVKLEILTRKAHAVKKNKGKQICDDLRADSDKQKNVAPENCLATLDIFAGCGGLSEGLQLSGNVFPSACFLLDACACW